MVFPVFEKNDAQSRTPSRSFVGEPTETCLARVKDATIAPLMQHREDDHVILLKREVDGIGKAAHEHPAKRPVDLRVSPGIGGEALKDGVGFRQESDAQAGITRLIPRHRRANIVPRLWPDT